MRFLLIWLAALTTITGAAKAQDDMVPVPMWSTQVKFDVLLQLAFNRSGHKLLVVSDAAQAIDVDTGKGTILARQSATSTPHFITDESLHVAQVYRAGAKGSYELQRLDVAGVAGSVIETPYLRVGTPNAVIGNPAGTAVLIEMGPQAPDGAGLLLITQENPEGTTLPLDPTKYPEPLAVLGGGDAMVRVNDQLLRLAPDGSEVQSVQSAALGFGFSSVDGISGVVSASGDQIALPGTDPENFDDLLNVFDLEDLGRSVTYLQPDLPNVVLNSVAYLREAMRFAYYDYGDDDKAPRRVFIYDAFPDRSPQLVATMEFNSSHVRAALSPDGSKVAILTTNNMLTMFDLSGTHVSSVPKPDLVVGMGGLNTMADVALSPDNSLLVTADYEGEVWLWDAATGRALRSLGAYNWPFTRFADDGETLAILDDNSIRHVDIRTGHILWQNRGVPPRVVLFERVQDGYLVCHVRGCSYHSDQQDALGEPLAVPTALNGAVLCDNALVLYDNHEDGDARLYRVGWFGKVRVGDLFSTGIAAVSLTAIACGDSGDVYLGDEDGTLYRFDAMGRLRAEQSIGSEPVRTLTFLAGTGLLAGSAVPGRAPARMVATDADTLEPVWTQDLPAPPSGFATYVDHFALSEDGTRALVVSQNGDTSPDSRSNVNFVSLWDVEAMREHIAAARSGGIARGSVVLRTGLAQGGKRPRGIAFTPDGARLAVNYGANTVVWSMKTGQVERHFAHNLASGITFVPNGIVLPEAYHTRIAKWDRSNALLSADGVEQFAIFGPSIAVARGVLARAVGEKTAIWTGQETDANAALVTTEGSWTSSWRTLSPTGDRLLVQTVDGLQLHNMQPGAAPLWSITEPADRSWRLSVLEKAAYSWDGMQIIVPMANYGSDARYMMLDQITGAIVGTIPQGNGAVPLRVANAGNGPEQWAIFQPDERGNGRLVTGADNTETPLIPLRGFVPIAGSMSPDGRTMALQDVENRVLLWNAVRGQSMLIDAAAERALAPAHTIAFSPTAPVMAIAEHSGAISLIETETGERIARLVSFSDGGWAVVGPGGRYDASDPGQMDRLSWVMADDPLYPLPVASFIRDYFEPRLLGRLLAGEVLDELPPPSKRNRVTPDAQIVDIKASTPRSDGVPTMKVIVALREGVRNGQRSGLGAVKLFRDGQLVGQADTNRLDAAGQASLTFDRIAWPSGAGRLTVYAFNDDGIKGITQSRVIEALPEQPTPADRRAYVIAVGVNAHVNPAWNLRYAADDADATAERLGAELRRSSAFAEVTALALTSRTDGDQPGRASSAMIVSVLRQLAGTATKDDLALPGVPILPRARPQDLVYIALAGHGLAGDGGIFHFFTQDFGVGTTGRTLPTDLSPHSLDSDELTTLLRAIDVRNMVLVIDACNAAASVEGAGFKPGPMGSQGLGQLAYDKSMRVLAASQAEAVALESDQLRHGALTFALLREGLDAAHADTQPRDGVINLGEFLSFGRDRVPDLYRGLRLGLFTPLSRGAVTLSVDQGVPLLDVQQPILFDFRKDKDAEVLLATVQ